MWKNGNCWEQNHLQKKGFHELKTQVFVDIITACATQNISKSLGWNVFQDVKRLRVYYFSIITVSYPKNIQIKSYILMKQNTLQII